MIETPDGHQLGLVAVAAFTIGSLNLHVNVGSTFAKGDELGYFQYGGSTVGMFFPGGTVASTDAPPYPNATLVQMGMPLATLAH